MHNINEYIASSLSSILLPPSGRLDFADLSTACVPMPAYKLLSCHSSPFSFRGDPDASLGDRMYLKSDGVADVNSTLSNV